MINIVLSHDSALAYWRQQGIFIPDEALGKVAIRKALASTRGTLQKPVIEAAVNRPWLSEFPTPLHLLVGDERDRRRTTLAQFHPQKAPLPKNSIFETDQMVSKLYETDEKLKVLVSSPELLFVQMGWQLDFISLLEIGYEICGNYALNPQSIYGIVDRSPVTSQAKLRSFVLNNDNIPGIKQARRAVKYICDNSRSPKETQIALLGILPTKMGGFGLGAPMLNPRLSVPENAARILESDTCMPDLYWPEIGIAIEYDSNAYHRSTLSLDHDARKRNAYALMGIDLRVITSGQLRDFGTFANIMREIRERQRHAVKGRRKKVPLEDVMEQELLHERLIKQVRMDS